ncbi:Flagellar motor rotation protein MotB [Minicystis rosea]|nr:Flagellar motor rotation protein MotB [Minicystis rosea]
MKNTTKRAPARWRAGLFMALLGALAPTAFGESPAHAQGKALPDRIPTTNGAGMDLNLFRPAVDAKGFFATNGADILGGSDLSLGLVLDYGHNIAKLGEGHGASHLATHAFKGVFQFDYGIANILVVGISVPVVLNGGEKVTDIGPGATAGKGGKNADYSSDALNAQALGDLALHVKIPILRPEGPIGIAVLAQAGVGVGGSRNLASEPGFFYWPQLILEERVGIVRMALDVGYRGHTGQNPTFGIGKDKKPQLASGVLEYENLMTGSFAVSVRPIPVIDLVGETYATYLVGGASDRKQRPSAEALFGIKLFIEKSSYFSAAVGPGYAPGFQTAQVRGMIGFIYEPSIGSRPEPDADRDHDGVPDKRDRCPDVPGDKTGREDDDGCPSRHLEGDRDGDGILDKNDKCPDDAEDRDGFEDSDGCPDPDNDKDGIPDGNDKCPLLPEDKDGFEDSDGCPDPDNDKDGILDADDKCPDKPETWNGFEDADGCPDQGRVVLDGNKIVILDKIQFKTGSAEILKESFPVVEAVAATMAHHPEFELVEVQGHADERGPAARNLKLTQERANAVVEAMVQKGIDRGRLRGMGYGPYCPIDGAHGDAAWEKNRRVEFKVVMLRGASTNMELGCEQARAKGVSPPPLPVPKPAESQP